MEKQLAISDADKKILLHLLNKYLPNTKAWAYGSRVTGKARPASDLDLVVFANREQSLQVGDLREAFEESDLTFRVDLFVWDSVPESFKKTIEEEHVVLCDTVNEALQEHVRRYGKTIEKTDVPLWRKSIWGDEVRLEYGKALRNYDSGTGKFRVYGSNGPIGWTQVALADGPGVILGRKGAYRGVEYSQEPFFVIDTAYYVVPRTETDMRWLYYAIKHYKLGEIDDGSPIPSTTRAAVYTKDIVVPPFSEQKQISRHLGVIDDRIQLLRETNATLEAMAQALFKSWFVAFDPVHVKAEGRTPEGMDAETAALFPAEFEESELGMIPKGWRCGSLIDIASYLNGLALQKYPASEGKSLPVIKIAQLRKGNTEGADRASASLPNDYLVQDGDVLFSWSGSLEVEIWCGGVGALNQHLFKVSSEKYPKWFYYFWTKYHLNEFRMIAASKATTMGHIQRKHLTEARVLIPSSVAVKKLDAYFSHYIDLIVNNLIQARTLTALRDTLLPRLISGKLRLPEFAKTTSEATV